MAASKRVEYRHGSCTMEGLLISGEELADPAPTVLVCHGMEGRSDAQIEFANRILPWGYQSFVVDLYGTDASASTPEQLLHGFLDDRAMLADRLSAAVSAVTGMSEVDSSRVAAIGFCFGGLCVLDMVRIGLDVTGVASFHGG